MDIEFQQSTAREPGAWSRSGDGVRLICPECCATVSAPVPCERSWTPFRCAGCGLSGDALLRGYRFEEAP